MLKFFIVVEMVIAGVEMVIAGVVGLSVAAILFSVAYSFWKHVI